MSKATAPPGEWMRHSSAAAVAEGAPDLVVGGLGEVAVGLPDRAEGRAARRRQTTSSTSGAQRAAHAAATRPARRRRCAPGLPPDGTTAARMVAPVARPSSTRTTVRPAHVDRRAVAAVGGLAAAQFGQLAVADRVEGRVVDTGGRAGPPRRARSRPRPRRRRWRPWRAPAARAGPSLRTTRTSSGAPRARGHLRPRRPPRRGAGRARARRRAASPASRAPSARPASRRSAKRCPAHRSDRLRPGRRRRRDRVARVGHRVGRPAPAAGSGPSATGTATVAAEERRGRHGPTLVRKPRCAVPCRHRT